MVGAVGLFAKERDGPSIRFVLLFYAVTDGEGVECPHNEFANGPWLTRYILKWYWPLQASLEQLEDQLPVLIITDEHEVMLDEVTADSQDHVARRDGHSGRLSQRCTRSDHVGRLERYSGHTWRNRIGQCNAASRVGQIDEKQASIFRGARGMTCTKRQILYPSSTAPKCRVYSVFVSMLP